jgi:hypothetical protein
MTEGGGAEITIASDDRFTTRQQDRDFYPMMELYSECWWLTTGAQ